MSDVSAILSLPYILPSQAQKHVTHNEALRLLDTLVQLTVTDADRTAPPPSPADGDRHIVAAPAAGDWTGAEGHVALYADGGWILIPPRPGWRAHVLAEGQALVHDGSAWAPEAPGSLDNLDHLGINTTADGTNRLAVSAAATLLTHAGAGHQLKLNKAAAGDTASLLFQTGWGGRAEMGTAGSDDFAVKVSADGSAWSTGLSLAAATGRAGLPQGATVGGTIDGDAVQQAQDDATPGRLMPVGAFGLGGDGVMLDGSDDLDALGPSGLYCWQSGSIPANTPAVFAGGVLHIRVDSTTAMQVTLRMAGAAYPEVSGALYSRSRNASGWGGWTRLFHRGDAVGTVSQTGGLPTGAMVERGSNANGAWTRYADGTQICTRLITVGSAGSTDWSFPASFSAAPAGVSGNPQVAAARMLAIGNVTTTTARLRVYNTAGTLVDTDCLMLAVGRWF